MDKASLHITSCAVPLARFVPEAARAQKERMRTPNTAPNVTSLLILSPPGTLIERLRRNDNRSKPTLRPITDGQSPGGCRTKALDIRSLQK
jgi:hypothetical protein